MLVESTYGTRSDVPAPHELRARPVLRSDPIRSSKRYQNGAPSAAAPTEISRPRTFRGQPQIPSSGLGLDQPKGIPVLSSKFAASSAHLVGSAGVLQKF